MLTGSLLKVMAVGYLQMHLLTANVGLIAGLSILLLMRVIPTQGFSMMKTNLKPQLTDLGRSNKLFLGLQNVMRGRDMDPLSPQGSWFLFNENDARQKKRNRKKCKRCANTIPMPKEGPPGPQGPRGPQGPQGLSGGILSLKEIENYIQVYLADLLLTNETLNSEFLIKRRKSPFRMDVPVIFTAQLPRKELVPSLKASVIRGLTVTFGPGQFKRGVIIKRGKFTVTRGGVYQVGGTFPILKREKSDEVPDDKKPSLYLCVDNCMADRRLRWTASPESRSTTATFSGHVRLKRGQSLMVLLSNPTRSDFEVLSGSTFSAALIGT